MLTAQELRIGNWVNKDQPGTVRGIGVMDDDDIVIVIDGEDMMGKLHNIEPIELTPEILEKAGFELHENSNEFYDHWVYKTGWHFSIWKKDEQVAGFEEKGVGYWGEIYVAVRNLHQLQNLFHALTGEELEVNL